MTARLVHTWYRRCAWCPGLLGLSLGGLLMLSACRRSQSDEAAKPPDAATPKLQQILPPAREVELALVGFNYTDLAIESFSVDHQGGGGNIEVSSPTSGGGGDVCCVRVDLNSPLPYSVLVQWTRDLKRWCEKEVQVKGPMPAHPGFFAVHFFPDGHLEAEITEAPPVLRLSLERFASDARKATGNTVADEKTARCHDGRF